jgi:hypothetical protein
VSLRSQGKHPAARNKLLALTTGIIQGFLNGDILDRIHKVKETRNE